MDTTYRVTFSKLKFTDSLLIIGQIMVVSARADGPLDSSYPPICAQALDLRSRGLPWQSEIENCYSKCSFRQAHELQWYLLHLKQRENKERRDSLRSNQVVASQTQRQAIERERIYAPATLKAPTASNPTEPVSTTQDSTWQMELPSVDVVRSKVGPDINRQDATFAVLQDYIEARAGKTRPFWSAAEYPLPRRRMNEYESAKSMWRNGHGTFTRILRPEAYQYQRDYNFRVDVLTRVVSPQAAAAFQATPLQVEIKRYLDQQQVELEKQKADLQVTADAIEFLRKDRPEPGSEDVTGQMTDPRDNSTYKTVTIGSQTWMAQNLNLPLDGSGCYENDPAMCKKYGRLYFWKEAHEACPIGWHLPSEAEWNQLEKTVGDAAGKKLKSNSWDGRDDYGFSALPAGIGRTPPDEDKIVFNEEGDITGFWTSSEQDTSYAFFRCLGSDVPKLYSALRPCLDLAPKKSHGKVISSPSREALLKNFIGLSVRCIKE